MGSLIKYLLSDAGSIKNSILTLLVAVSTTAASAGFGLHAILYSSISENTRTTEKILLEQTKLGYEKKIADLEREHQTLIAKTQETIKPRLRKEKLSPSSPKLKPTSTEATLKDKKNQVETIPVSAGEIITRVDDHHNGKKNFHVGEYIYFSISYASTSPEGIQIFAIPNSQTDIGMEFDPSERLVGAGIITRKIRVSKPGTIESIDIKIRENQGPLLKVKTIPANYVFTA